jgi:hypothetical protein
LHPNSTVFSLSVQASQWQWNVRLAAPATLVITYFFIAATEVAIRSGTGIKNAVSFLAIPLDAALGIWLKVKPEQHLPATRQLRSWHN